MEITLKVNYVDGKSDTVTAVFADFVAFERTWNKSVMKLEREMRLTDLSWLAWHVLKFEGKTEKVFDPDWLRTVAALETVAADEPEQVDSPLEKDQPLG